MATTKQMDFPEILAKAYKLLSIRDHSVSELSQKLGRYTQDLGIIQSVITQCLEDKVLNDEHFAYQYVRFRSAKGYGPLRITSELKQRGIDDVLIQTMLAHHDFNWDDVITRIYQKKFSGKRSADPMVYQKQYRFLQQRGFSADMIAHCLKR